MARALVLQLLLAGVAALPPHPTSEAVDTIPSHLRGHADALDHATSHSRYLRPIDEGVAGAHLGQHDQHALTPPDGNGLHHAHRSARGQSRPVGTPDAAHDRARRAPARAAHGQTPGHLQLERRRNCGDVTITDTETAQRYRNCETIHYLKVRARARPPSPALG